MAYGQGERANKENSEAMKPPGYPDVLAMYSSSGYALQQYAGRYTGADSSYLPSALLDGAKLGFLSTGSSIDLPGRSSNKDGVDGCVC